MILKKPERSEEKANAKTEQPSNSAMCDDEIFDSMDDLPDLGSIRGAIAETLEPNPRSAHYTRKEATDLQALDIDCSGWSSDADSALNQLDWFSDRRCFEWAYDSTQEDFQHLYSQDLEKWNDIWERSSIELRDSRGFLTRNFKTWYRQFCNIDPCTGYRPYSAEMWARGDFFGEKDPTKKELNGGKKGKELQTIIVEWLASRVLDELSGRPGNSTSAAEVWRHIRKYIDGYCKDSLDKFQCGLEWVPEKMGSILTFQHLLFSVFKFSHGTTDGHVV